MEWSTPSDIENMRGSFVPSQWLESNSFNSLNSFNYDPYAGTSQTGPVISIPESENMFNEYQYPSNNNEKRKRLTNEQLASLEEHFQEDGKLDSDRKLKLSEELGMQPRQVATWFQNRRARWKVKNLEEPYDSLKKEYDKVSKENQTLHVEVNTLRGIIQQDQVMRMQLNLNNNQIEGSSQICDIDQYNNPMHVASTQPSYQW